MSTVRTGSLLMDVFHLKMLLLMFLLSAEVVDAQQPEQLRCFILSDGVSLKDDCFCSW